ncbi:hypothetical protein H2O64_14645 [Kordia sp. YSTF-M3]|uniref:DUF2059 domain-containing protein n=1 Tax=Kordia aestuariivivens TaxID=2759037 RepID=A0ABR7QC56_9FLAO|nr:hypothetical protein [Kordia aestuariivivens]MBC8755914.1 hypothetical protein [Kordia aestuariivivens]
MKKLLIAVLLFVCVQTSFAQTDPYIENVKHYLTINGTQEQYEGAVDAMFVMLKKQFKDYKVSDAIWKELESAKKPQVEEVKAVLVSAYKAYFTMNDIKNMTVFYESTAAKLMLADPSKLTATHRQQIGNFYDSETGQKMIVSKDGLAKIEGEISMQWSGEFYKSVIHKLAEKGYSLN